MADERSPQKRAADDALATEPELTITPELWLKGVKVDANFEFELDKNLDPVDAAQKAAAQKAAAMAMIEPYKLIKRTFATRADEVKALADYDTMCASGMNPQKAYRLCLCAVDDATARSREDLLRKLLGI
jgi:hypothetical protein